MVSNDLKGIIIEDYNSRPPRDLEYAKRYSKRFGNFATSRFVDRIEVTGLENLAGLSHERSYVYVGNHQTVGDLFGPHHVILDNGLPSPRTVAKESLRKVKPIFDFEKFGIIWIDRSAKKRSDLGNFTSLIADTFRDNESLWIFPEGTRSKTFDQEPMEFKPGSFGTILDASEIAGVRPDIICVAMKYDFIPEGIFGTSQNSFIQKIISAVEIAYWISPLNAGRGAVRIAFSRPYTIAELAGDGSFSRQRKELAHNTHEIVSEMWRRLS
jgi:1-acyl-sn-glycerol-3-phosphate acyltransferase